MQLSVSQSFQVNRAGLERADLQQQSLGRQARLVNMVELGSALTRLDHPPVKAIVVYNSNPAAVAPNQNAVLAGFRREDLFTVVLEQFQNDTADYADILLPVTTFLEHTDLYISYGHYYLQLARPALSPPGEARSNVEIFRELALRMGFHDACFRDSDDDMIRTLLDSPHPFVHGIGLEELDRSGSVRLRLPKVFQPFAEGGFGAADGKCHFHAETLDYTPPVESRHGDGQLRRKYPLEMISPKNDDSMNSTFGHRDAVDLATATLHLNASDAARLGIRTSDQVRAFNDRGSCVFIARVDDSVQPGVVCAPAVRWGKRAPGKRNANALTSERLSDAGNGPVFYSCLVQVERIGD
jgi:anaerobic selenocysteine-containing dehydrogenase